MTTCPKSNCPARIWQGPGLHFFPWPEGDPDLLAAPVMPRAQENQVGEHAAPAPSQKDGIPQSWDGNAYSGGHRQGQTLFGDQRAPAGWRLRKEGGEEGRKEENTMVGT